MTLKTVLRNFLNHVESIEARRQVAADLYEIEFQKLKELTESLKQHQDYSVRQGELEVNKRKNRYKDILPYDHTRVIISEYPSVPGSDYVNANYIRGASGSLAYIASQGPLPNTVVDFWRMIWECEVQVIVMACNEKESGKYKCECYWPNNEGETERQYGNVTVELVKWRHVCPDFLVRTLKYRCLGEEERSLCQFHYTTWPDHGVPTTVQPILDMVRLMRDCQASEAVPILIHCSAGCGRTGTICAIDYVWSLMRLGKLSESFNLYDIVSEMRKQRIAMVQTKEQYVLVHRAVSSLFEQQLRVIDNHTYENLDDDGQPLMLKEIKNGQEHIYEDVSTLIATENNIQLTDSWKNVSQLSYMDENLDNIGQPLNKEQENEEGGEENASQIKRRNSHILQKLCEEESVKRLISGWNKGSVENQEDIENFDKSSSDFIATNKLAESGESTSHSINDSLLVSHMKPLKKDVSPSEKLIGKATVIRRPSIAKLKALFEKSQNIEMMSASVNDGDGNKRRVRPLGRSHSHHVSRGRISPSSDKERDSDIPRKSIDRERSVRRVVSPLVREIACRVKVKTSEIVSKSEDTSSSNDLVEVKNAQSEQQQQNNSSTQWYKNQEDGGNVHMRETTGIKLGCLELRTDKSSSWYGEYDAIRNGRATWYQTKEMEKLGGSASDVNQKPPELPVKKKMHKIEAENDEEKDKTALEFYEPCALTVENSEQPPTPEDSQTPPRLPEKKMAGRHPSIKHKQRNELLLSRIDGVVQCRKSVCIPISSNSDQKVSCQELLGPSAPSLGHSQSLKHSSGKTIDPIADRYTNINLTSQKNIAQIENTIKQHPRGAIIDLTSRASFVEQQQQQSIFQKPSPEGFVVNEQKNKPYENLWGNFNVKKCVTNEAQTIEVDTIEKRKMEISPDNIESNLLLHSPPPRTRRHHLSKTGFKSKSEGETLATKPQLSDKSISSDKEINKAVNELNSIGHLLDTLATQTLEDLNKDHIKNPLEEHSRSSSVQEDKPVLPKKLNKSSCETVPKDKLQSRTEIGDISLNDQNVQKYEKPLDSPDTPKIQCPPALHTDYEYIYPLQKSASAPHSSKMFSANQQSQEKLSYYQPKLFESGPPKPPRTFTHIPQHKYDGGRLLVSVASPKSLKFEDPKQSAVRYNGHSTSSSSKIFPFQYTYTYPDTFSQTDAYNSQPTSPMHSNYPPVLVQGNTQPLSYRTYPSYPEIHSVRAIPHHLPMDSSSIHQVRPSLFNFPSHCKHIVHHQEAITSSVQRSLHKSRGKQYHLPYEKSHNIPDYGQIPIVPVYTMVHQDQEHHRVQWDSSVDDQQLGKIASYENIYDVPRDTLVEQIKDYDPTIYTVVNKNNELRHSQSDASVYSVLRMSSKQGEREGPLYSQVMKPKSKNAKPFGEENYHRRSRDDMDILPVAPPRGKRQGAHLRRSLPDGGLCDHGFATVDHDESNSEDDPPAVPVKTKGAYINVSLQSKQKVGKSTVQLNSQGGLGGTLSRALGKLNLLTKLTNKTELLVNHHVPIPPMEQTSKEEDRSIKRSPTKQSSSNLTPGLRSPIFGFPHRMQRRPKGPREPPEQWTQV